MYIVFLYNFNVCYEIVCWWSTWFGIFIFKNWELCFIFVFINY
jgi:hypothetical protein